MIKAESIAEAAVRFWKILMGIIGSFATRLSYMTNAAIPMCPIIKEEMICADDQLCKTPPLVIP
jgi:hypothetical protein